jgi:hypothetical protein
LAAAALKWDGFKIVSTGVADRRDYSKSRIVVYAAETAAVEKLARSLKLPATAIQDVTTMADPPIPASDADILVILGSDYNPCQR